MTDLLNRVLGLVIFCIVSPFLLILSLVIMILDGWPVLFFQKRVGYKNKVFWIIKFRTMVINSDNGQSSLKSLNEADGPVFKIRNDPRFTLFGKWLSRSGLDELPQLLNVIRGEMALVGPRPLPQSEANRLTKSQSIRSMVLPGITSSWVVGGGHSLSFKEWMRMDKEYVNTRSTYSDIQIIWKTIKFGLAFLLMSFKHDILMLSKYIWRYKLVLLLVLAGLFLRFMRMRNQIFWNDEVYYFDIYRFSSLWDLVASNHWIVDHPPLYFVLMKLWSHLLTDPTWLRSLNLIFYLVSSRFIYLIGDYLLKSDFSKLLLIALYAIFPYFTALEWQAIPYTLAMCMFLGSILFFMKTFDVDNSSKNAYKCAIFLFLFLLSSFESVYFILTLVVYTIFIFIKSSTELKSKLLSLFLVLGFLSFPEITVILNSISSFSELNSHWLSWHWSTLTMLKDVFGVSNSIYFGLFFITPSLLLLFKLQLVDSTKYIVNFLLFVIGGFLIAIDLVSRLFFYASHPKAYYYVIFVVFLLCVIIFEWFANYYRKKIVFVYLVVVISILSWFRPSQSWVLADYLYGEPPEKPHELRKSLIDLVDSDNEWKVVVDEDVKGDDWMESIYLGRYYLRCHDMKEPRKCYFMENRNLDDRKYSRKFVGVFIDHNSRYKFVYRFCGQTTECLLWDFKIKSFVNVGLDR